MAEARTWGFWTEQKLEMLAAYLPAFTTAAKNKARGRTVYLDLFAGSDRNISRTTGEQIDGSPRLALATAPEFTKAYFFELPSHAAKLETDLRAAYPGRDFKVWPGDCNEQIEAALRELQPLRSAPTFALVDQYAAEIHWSTLQKLAGFKRNSKYKTELWLLFAHAMLPRGLATESPAGAAEFTRRVDSMYGSHEWSEAYDARQAGEITAAQLRFELANLMRWRLERVLGYQVTHSFEMINTRGIPIYTMIFATDNDAGNKIMSHIYKVASQKQPEMRRQAVRAHQQKRDEAAGLLGLFDIPVESVAPSNTAAYVHLAPTQPYRSGGEAVDVDDYTNDGRAGI